MHYRAIAEFALAVPLAALFFCCAAATWMPGRQQRRRVEVFAAIGCYASGCWALVYAAGACTPAAVVSPPLLLGTACVTVATGKHRKERREAVRAQHDSTQASKERGDEYR